MEALQPVAALQLVESVPAQRSTLACGTTPARSSAPAYGSTLALGACRLAARQHDPLQPDLFWVDPL
ncbi:hypothetical protein Nepgr_026809 [Nepenthes gracilis]|uniref:Uncharacterized protein n=1 Tax=Nepenthes gracilis TaxID=150966 RepID=A0AAD3TAE9_NEPGR|nr:hypothetical protein Nepgr_026809 [Nepenthes gracilis]